MISTGINSELIEGIKTYVNKKTHKNYFKHIRQLSDNIQITCPFHKDGQENKPSAAIRITETENSYPGQFHCFTCGETMSLSNMIKEILDDLYDPQEVEDLFGLEVIVGKAMFFEQEKTITNKIKTESYIDRKIIKAFKQYHSYYQNRRITKDTVDKYDLGYDEYSKQIIFPIYNIKHKCIGLGRRSIEQKIYKYPLDMKKPLYRII